MYFPLSQITTNLYSIPITTILPYIDNYKLSCIPYNLRYSSSTGIAYVIETTISSLVAIFFKYVVFPYNGHFFSAILFLNIAKASRSLESEVIKI